MAGGQPRRPLGAPPHQLLRLRSQPLRVGGKLSPLSYDPPPDVGAGKPSIRPFAGNRKGDGDRPRGASAPSGAGLETRSGLLKGRGRNLKPDPKSRRAGGHPGMDRKTPRLPRRENRKAGPSSLRGSF